MQNGEPILVIDGVIDKFVNYLHGLVSKQKYE